MESQDGDEKLFFSPHFFLAFSLMCLQGLKAMKDKGALQGLTEEITEFQDRFYMSRIGIRFLFNQVWNSSPISLADMYPSLSLSLSLSLFPFPPLSIYYGALC